MKQDNTKKIVKKEQQQKKESETGSFVMEYFAADHQTRSYPHPTLVSMSGATVKNELCEG